MFSGNRILAQWRVYLAGLAALALSCTGLQADTTYDYVGNGYTTGGSGSFVYASFTVPVALPDNFSGQPVGITNYLLGITDPPGSPYFGTSTLPNEILGGVSFDVSTNSAGAITFWDIVGNNGMVDYSTCNEPVQSSCGAGMNLAALDYAEIDVHHTLVVVDTQDNPGSWLALVDTPEPSPAVLTGLGVLGLLSVIATQRRLRRGEQA